MPSPQIDPLPSSVDDSGMEVVDDVVIVVPASDSSVVAVVFVLVVSASPPSLEVPAVIVVVKGLSSTSDLHPAATNTKAPHTRSRMDFLYHAAAKVAHARRRSAGSRAFTLLVVALVAAHVWPPFGGPEPFLFGALPWDLAISLAWMVMAAGAVVWMTTASMWPDQPRDDS
jgi:hypothetical protein